MIDFHSLSDILLIDPNGIRICCYSRPFRDTPDQIPTSVHRFPNLPNASIATRYEYGRRFVSLVRSKTPRVVLLCSDCKGYLFDVDPRKKDFNPKIVNNQSVVVLFQLRYTNGPRLEVSMPTSCSSFSIKNSIVTGTNDSVSINYCLSKFKQCVTADANRLPLDPYPLIIREDDIDPGCNITNLISVASASMNVSLNAHAANVPDIAKTFTGYPRIEPDRSFECAFRTHLPDVGWCLASPFEQFLMLFFDGQTVLIDGTNNRVAFHDRFTSPTEKYSTSQPSRWYSIDQSLPPDLKAKLVHFPDFVNLLKQGQSHTFL